MSQIPDAPSAAVRPPLASFGRRLRRSLGLPAVIELLLDWQERANQRAALRALDERMLRDIGLSRADIENECSKPFWRV